MHNEYKSHEELYDVAQDAGIEHLSEELQFIWKETFALSKAIINILDRKPTMVVSSEADFERSQVAAYLLSIVYPYSNPYSISFDDLQDKVEPEIFDLAKKFNIEDSWNELIKLVFEFHPSCFGVLPKFHMESTEDSSIQTPSGVAQLSAELLDVHEDEKVCDLCCGKGSVSRHIKDNAPSAIVEGYDVSEYAIAIAKVRNSHPEDGLSYRCSDVFTLPREHAYDKVFAHYPAGIKIRNLGEGKQYYSELSHRIPAMSKITSSDWLFNFLILDQMKDTGKGICIMATGGTWNAVDAPIRQYFIENGLIECVIALPVKMMSSSFLSTSLVVFSHGNSVVRLVNATKEYVPGRRINSLSNENLDAIIAATYEDSEISTTVSIDELRENNYVLNAARYLENSPEIENGVPFEYVITRITRGAQLNASMLDKIASPVPSTVQYLLLANIQNGLIEKDLPYLKQLDEKDEKYCLTDHCVILSKSGMPYKVAVAEVAPGQRILANGNLYIIEIDEKKANPYYIAAFLSSEQGVSALKRISSGTTVLGLGVDSLRKMTIPLPPMEDQNLIAEQYKTIRDEISLLLLKIERAKEKMSRLLEEGDV